MLRSQDVMTNARSRCVFWRRKWSRECAIGFAGFTIIILALRAASTSWSKENVPIQKHDPGTAKTDTDVLVDLKLVVNAKDRGAVCLDGSPPGYHYQKGFGSGIDNWVLHIEGGGWCDTVASCALRKMTPLGSSTLMELQIAFSGILSNDQSQNPDFFNWNKVKIRYCDGGSLSGNLENEVQDGSKLFFRGQRIWKSIMGEFLSIGLANARKALFSGCSAGGLAALLHCDDFRTFLPKSAVVKCLADASFFLDENDISGKSTMRSFYHDVVKLQGIEKGLQECNSKLEPYQCFFPQHFIKNIRTPVFLVNPAYDFWQIQHVLAPDAADPDHHWLNCKQDITKCSPDQLKILHGFRTSLLNALSEFQQSKNGGMFINSCFAHCQTWMGSTWHAPNSPRLNNRTIAEAVADWFFDRKAVKKVDCPYPCNPTCYSVQM